jgi:enamine deaminase RidA (YjgF/YER057c/UK114 family)
VVEATGAKMSDITKTTVYITDLANFAAMNEIYKSYFPADPPARATVKADWSIRISWSRSTRLR